ncbi:MRP/NBP35 family protein [Aeropyrum pernix]|uniref:Iron-sulfur cluster carrier protein n=1 Tax=Aeropyrum pernix TaxID=56636 RepID=A0A401HB76_AERPX|nr:Mrp/NBP35 family ATP-binding protein [Aeropyrum pernix]GBF09667.1 MRP/NBP35 family protein [Aeropyrum pernix]
MSTQEGGRASKGFRVSRSEYKAIAERMKTIQEQQMKIVRNMRRIKYKIAVISTKGGVGKSFVTASLAAALAAEGRRVGVFDADISGPSVHKMLGLQTGMGMPSQLDGTVKPVEVPPGIKVASIGLLLPMDEVPLIWRGAIKTSAIRELLAYVDWGELDYLLIDLPPGTGDEVLTITQIIPNITGFLVVTIPSEIAKSVVKKAVSFAKRIEAPVIGIVENMSYFRCSDGSIHYIFGRGAAEEIASQYGIELLGKIPIDPAIRESNDKGKIFFLENPESEASKEFLKIARRTIEIVEKLGPKPPAWGPQME